MHYFHYFINQKNCFINNEAEDDNNERIEETDEDDSNEEGIDERSNDCEEIGIYIDIYIDNQY